MWDFLRAAGDVIAQAGLSVIEVVVLGPLLILSVTGNVILVAALVRCYRAKHHLRDRL